MNSSIPFAFVSSTVTEFRDLRSAIAYTLRTQGFNVYLSEAAGFDVKGDRSAFEECFTNIRESDFYILIIGNTRGSLFQEGISITRQEYRIARETFLTYKRPRLLMFLRNTTEIALSGSEQDRLKAGIDDAEHLTSLINEVKSPGIEGAPNYLITFHDFEDLMTSLAGSMNLGRNLSEKLIRHSLLSELLSNLTHIVSGTAPVLHPRHWYMQKVRESISLTPDDINRNIDITYEQSRRLGMSLIGRLLGDNLQIRCMEDAIDRGVFLTFNPTTSVLEETPIHKLLHQIITDIYSLRRLDIANIGGNWSENITHAIYDFTHKHTSTLTIRGTDLAFAFNHHDRTEDIYQGHLALCKVLLGLCDVLPPYKRQPLSPFGEEMDKEFRAEQVSAEQIATLIENNIRPFGDKYSRVHFGENREETVKKLAEILRRGEEERGTDMSLLEGMDAIFEKIADSLVSD